MERTVVWKAVANFSAISRESRKAKRDLESLRRKQVEVNAATAASGAIPGTDKNAQALRTAAKASQEAASAAKKNTTAQQKQVQELRRAEAAARGTAKGLDETAKFADKLSKSTGKVKAGKLSADLRGMERDSRRAARGLDDAARGANRYRREVEGAGAATRRASSDMGGMGRGLRDLRQRWDNNARGALRFGSALRLLAIPVVITGINALISLMSPLTAGFLGLAGAIAPVSGLLGALPGLLAAAGGSALTLIAGFAGIGNALKAYGQQQKNAAKAQASAAKDAAAAARQQLQQQRQREQAQKRLLSAQEDAKEQAVTNARAIRDARQSLADAEERAGDAALSSARAIESAERSVASAQSRASEAQKALTQARQQALQNIKELKDQVSSLAMDEESASLAVERARESLRRTINDPGSSDLDRREADLAVREAEARLADVRQQQKDNDKALKDAQRRGVEGSDEVIQARQDEADANRSVLDAQQQLMDAQRDATRSARDTARQIAQAQESLSDAYSNAEKSSKSSQEAIEDAQQAISDLAVTLNTSGGGTDSVDLFAEAMAGLTPEARAVVRQLISMKGLVDQIRATAQRGLMPGVLSFLKDSVDLFPLVNRFVGRAARSFGDFFAQAGKAMTTDSALRNWRKAFDSTDRVIDTFLKTTQNVGEVLGRIVVAGGPLVEWLADVALGWSEAWDEMTAGEAGQRRLEGFFGRAKRAAQILGTIIGNLTSTLVGLGRGTSDVGEWILQSFADMTQGWSDWVNSVQGQNVLKQWAQDSRPALSALNRLLGDMFKGLADLAGQTDIAGLLEQIRTQLLPALLRLMGIFTGDLARHIIDLISDVADFISSFADDSGVLDTFVTTLDSIVRGLQWVIDNVPGATEIIAALVTAMAVKKATNLATNILGINSALGALQRTAAKGGGVGTFALEALGMGGFAKAKPKPRRVKPGIPDSTALPRRARGKIPKSAVKAAGATPEEVAKLGKGAGAASSGIKALGSAFLKLLPAIGSVIAMIPGVGWVIGGIVIALGIAIPLIIKHWDTIKGVFMKAVNWTVGFLQKHWGTIHKYIIDPIMLGVHVVQTLWDWLKQTTSTILSSIVTGIRKIWDPLAPYFKSLVQIVAAIFAIAAVIWYKLVVDPWVKAFGWIVKNWDVIAKFFKTIVAAIVATFKFAWAVFYDLVITPFKRAFSWVATQWDKFRTIVSRGAQRVLDAIRPIISKVSEVITAPFRMDNVVGELLRKIRDTAKDWIGKIVDAVEALPDLAKKAFDKFKSVAGKPITDFVDKVINGGLIDGLNGVMKKLKMPESLRIDYMPVPHFARGGEVPGHGNRDTVPAMLMPGEVVIRKSSVKKIGKDRLLRLNENPQRFHDGGEVQGMESGGEARDGFLGALSKGWDVAKSLTQRAADIVRDGAANVLKGILDPIVSTLNREEDSPIGAILANAGKRLFNGALDFIKGHESESPLTDPLGLPEVTAEVGDYKRVNVGGGNVLNARTIRLLDRARRMGYVGTPQIMQGSYSMRVAASGTTHAGGGAVDLGISYMNQDERDASVAALRAAGFAAWERHPWEGYVPHIHAIAFGDKEASLSARYQMMNYRAGESGLGHERDYFAGKMKKFGLSYAHAGLVNQSGRFGKGAKHYAFASGGRAPGLVPAMLTPGEVVLNRQAVAALGPGGWQKANRGIWPIQRFNAGGPVRGVRPGASGPWVQALRSQLYLGTSSRWSNDLTNTLRKRFPKWVPAGFTGSTAVSKKVFDFLNSRKWRGKDYPNDLIWLGQQIGVDPTYLWRARNQVVAYLKAHKAQPNAWSQYNYAYSNFTKKRFAWVKALEAKLSEPQDGIWNPGLDAPLAHMLDHALGISHDEWAPRPWDPFTAGELAIQAQQRANKINDEFDKYTKLFSGWGLSYLVRKMGELGPSDGMDIARSLSKDKTHAVEYDAALKKDYDRQDAQNNPDSTGARIQLFLQTVGAGTSTHQVGLQEVAKALGVSLDTGVSLYDQISSGKLWGAVTPSQRARLDRDVVAFKKLFKFAGGGWVPRYGNGDRVGAMLTPGEFVLRKAAVTAIRQQFGNDGLSYLNNFDRMANGGFVAAGMQLPDFSPASIRLRSNLGATTGNTKTVNYNFDTVIHNPVAEPGAVSIQKRVTRLARLGVLQSGEGNN